MNYEEEFIALMNKLKEVIGGQQIQIGVLQYDQKHQDQYIQLLLAVLNDVEKLSDEREKNLNTRINDLENDVSKLYCEIAYLKVMSTPPKTFWQRLAKRLKSVLPKRG